jgi:hypothetical protein|nr:MAG TPA: protein of unknown function DUF2190 [Caudoviricetes sp.]
MANKGSYVNTGNTINYTNDTNSKIEAGSVVKIGDMVGIAACDIDVKSLGAVSISGVYDITKKTGEAIEAGKLVYYSTDGITATAGSNPRIGYTVAKALAGDKTARVRLG